MESKNKLRSGYTTGACAAAAAKAATLVLVRSLAHDVRDENQIHEVSIPFPDGSRATFKILEAGYRTRDHTAYASVIKDAGDDPDITHGAEIRAEISEYAEIGFPVTNADLPTGTGSVQTSIFIRGGKGVGTITKPGLAVPVGEPAINPIPRKMIREAMLEALALDAECRIQDHDKTGKAPDLWALCSGLRVMISVPRGEELAKKTLNQRLGIEGGISILGTTGIVKPLSEAAWTATISSSFDVAKALGREEVVVSTGRTSEKAHQKKFGFPEDCYAMMGDYTEFSLLDAKKHAFRRIHLCAQWGKMIKIAMATPQTHVRHGVLDAGDAVEFLNDRKIRIPREHPFNTSREIYDFINSEFPDPHSAFSMVCNAAKEYAEKITAGIPVSIHLVSYDGEIIAESE